MTVQDLFTKPENRQEESVILTVWYKNGSSMTSERPIPIGYNPETNVFVEEASTLQLKGWPIRVMLQTGSDEYAFHLSNPVFEGDELIFVEYKGIDTRAKLRVFND